jgi:hypothetical protein
MAKPGRAIFTEIVASRHCGKIGKHASIPEPGAFPVFEIPFHVIADIEAVAGRAYKIARTAGEAEFGSLFPDGMLIPAFKQIWPL